jgi:phospholipid transport system substrate-binding protein
MRASRENSAAHMMASGEPLTYSRRTLGSVAALAVVASLVFSWPSAQAASANPAEAFVQENVDRGYVILNSTTYSLEQRRAEFRKFMLSLTDPRRIGLFTLGQYANGAPKDQIEDFVSAFTDYAIATYEMRLNKYKGQTLKVTGSLARAPDDVVVNADAVSPGNATAQPIKVGFRVRKSADGRPIVTDIQVEGVWLALSERSDFTGYLQQHGGSIAALTQLLKAQTQQMRSSA